MNMQFDESKDILLGKQEQEVNDTLMFEVECRKYGEGQPKLQINRKVKVGDDWVHKKLGRLNAQEVRVVATLLAKMSGHLEV